MEHLSTKGIVWQPEAVRKLLSLSPLRERVRVRGTFAFISPSPFPLPSRERGKYEDE